MRGLAKTERLKLIVLILIVAASGLLSVRVASSTIVGAGLVPARRDREVAQTIRNPSASNDREFIPSRNGQGQALPLQFSRSPMPQEHTGEDATRVLPRVLALTVARFVAPD
jgi:hypothetical protein